MNDDSIEFWYILVECWDDFLFANSENIHRSAQSRHHLQTVQMTAELTPFLGGMNMALCDFWCAAP